MMQKIRFSHVNVKSNKIQFTINEAKLYVPVLTLLAEDIQNLLKLLRKVFARSFYWN